MHKYGFQPDLTGVVTLEGFLNAIQLTRLASSLAERGITRLEELTDEVAEALYVSEPAVKPKLSVALRLLRQRDRSPMSDEGSTSSSDAAMEVGADPPMQQQALRLQRRTQPNSTSSLYIHSTITTPDVAHLCFCVSLVIHDLIADAEATRQAGGGNVANDPLGVFLPVGQIFSVAGKRRRSEYEGGGAAEVGAMGPPPPPSPPREVPTEEDIRNCIADLHALARFTPGCLVVALIYMERLRRGTGALLLASTWQPIVLISIIVAQKVWEDRAHLNVDFTQLCPNLTIQQLNSIERNFLRLIDYNVGVKATIYTEWYFHLCALCEREDAVSMRPLDSRQAHALEISTTSWAARLAHARDADPMGRLRPNSSPDFPLGGAGGAEEVNGAATPRSRAIIS